MDNEVKVETKKKGNALFTLFACVMTGVIVFLACNIGQKASKTVDPDTPKKNDATSNVESNTTSNVESNVTSNTTSTAIDATLQEAIKEKFFNLFASSNATQGGKKFVTAGNIGISLRYWNNIFTGKLTDVEKTYIILSGMTTDTAIDYTTSVFKDKSLVEAAETAVNGEPTIEAYEKSSFTYRYKNVFGVQPTYVDATGCGSYYYDSKNEVYVPIGMCGGDSSTSVLVYMDSISKSNDDIVVSAYVGSEVNSAEEGGITLYKDYETTKENVLESTKQFDKEYEINEQNKAKFTKYNFVFKKAADGQYYFNSVTKAN